MIATTIERLECRQFFSVTPLSDQTRALTGTRDLLYVRVEFSDQSSYPISESGALAAGKEATGFITSYSGGNLKFTVAVDSVKLKHSEDYYKAKGTTTLANDADATLKADGVSLTKYEHITYRYNGSIGSFAGLGQVPGKRTWLRSSTATVLTHELGHNLGLGHSHFADPTGSDPFGSSKSVEYGDAFSNMGYGGSKDWSAHQKYALGWLSGNRTKTIDASKSGTFTIDLSSVDNTATYSSSKTYLIRIKLSSTSALYVEYRSSVGGVLIHRDAYSSPKSGSLIDATPSTSSASDAGLKFGKKLVDKRGSGSSDDIAFSVEKSSGFASVTIKIGG